MKPRLLYRLLSLLSVISAGGAFIVVTLGIIGLAVDHQFRIDLFAIALTLAVWAVVLHALWDIGGRVLRMEDRQGRLMQDQEKRDK